MLPHMKPMKWTIAAFCALAGVSLLADEGMWRIDQLPVDAMAKKYGVRLTSADLDRLRYAPVPYRQAAAAELALSHPGTG